MNRMKLNFWIIALAALVIALPLSAQDKQQNTPYDIVQIGIWDSLAPNQNSVEVYGVRAGIPVCGGDAAVCGFEIGILGASSDEVSGFQWGVLAAISKKINGLALGLFTMTDVGNGVQIGVVNVAKERGVQIGLLNFIEDSSLSFFPFVNVKF